MRRFLSLVLLAAFGLPAVAPALALVQDTEASLPACCRHHGAHHCMGSMQRPLNSAPSVSERCPNFPQPATTPSQANGFTLLSAAQLISSHQISLVVQQPTGVPHRATYDFALYKRGPPSNLL